MHGGKSLKGVASATFKTGRHSKYMPARLLERYNEAAQDPELLNLREDIALIDARLADILLRADDGEAGKLWNDARKSNDELQKAMADKDWSRVRLAAANLDRLIGEGLTDHETWNEIRSLIDQRRRLVESEQKRLIAGQQMITSEQAMTLVAALVSTVKRHVTDRRILAAISADIAQIVATDSQRTVES